MSKTAPTGRPKFDNPEQYRRFVETARELGADESPAAMDKAFERVDVRQKPKDKKPPKDG
jgi:hypothetical protein